MTRRCVPIKWLGNLCSPSPEPRLDCYCGEWTFGPVKLNANFEPSATTQQAFAAAFDRHINGTAEIQQRLFA